MQIISQKDRIIWKNVARLLEQRGWTYAYLARKCKIRPQTINGAKSGIRGTGSKLLNKLADALEVEERELLFDSSLSNFRDIWPESVKKQCETVARILMSDHEPLKQALLASIAIFEENLQQSEKIKQQDEEIREIRRDLRELIRREPPGYSEPPGTRARSGKSKAT